MPANINTIVHEHSEAKMKNPRCSVKVHRRPTSNSTGSHVLLPLNVTVAVVLIWVHLHGDGPGTKETATRKRHDSTSDCMASSQRLCLRNADGNVANYSRK
eukprot:scaffold197740_cov32-Tisochrysis_lutea.AAC.2